jgi:hypothetical protein
VDIGDSAQKAVDTLFGFLPNLLGFVVILIIGYVVARVVKALAAKLLLKVGLDRMLSESEGGRFADRMLPGASASRGIARLLFWFVFAFFIVAAIGALLLDALDDFMNSVLRYLPNVIVAILIFVVAAGVAGVAGTAASRGLGDRPAGRIVGAVVPALVMVIALFMILDQLQIAAHIVSIAFAATMFALALGLALAFGLGGRDLARQMLEEAYANNRAARDRSGSDTAARSHAYAVDPYEAYSPEERELQDDISLLPSRANDPGTTTTTGSHRYPADPDRT